MVIYYMNNKKKQIEINMTVVMTTESMIEFDNNDTDKIKTLFKLFHAGRTEIKAFDILSVKECK